VKKKVFTLAALMVALGSTAGPASAQELLTGDTRLACEAVLCLSSGTRPGECSPSLERYFGIKKRKLSDTIRARLNFLNLCPVANHTPAMQSLVSAISQGAGRCDAASLNSTLTDLWYDSASQQINVFIRNQAPDYCTTYTSNGYTNFVGTLPRYVGDERRGGHWVEAQDYDRALAEYNERIRQEDAAAAERRRRGESDFNWQFR